MEWPVILTGKAKLESPVSGLSYRGVTGRLPGFVPVLYGRAGVVIGRHA